MNCCLRLRCSESWRISDFGRKRMGTGTISRVSGCSIRGNHGRPHHLTVRTRIEAPVPPQISKLFSMIWLGETRPTSGPRQPRGDQVRPGPGTAAVVSACGDRTLNSETLSDQETDDHMWRFLVIILPKIPGRWWTCNIAGY